MKNNVNEEIQKIKQLFSIDSLKRHNWYIDAVVKGDISHFDTKENKKKAYEKFLKGNRK